ncbi:3-oxoacyl-[acyl-carrier protein] reductase [Dehalobacter sp. UNSWDHB]|jgi:Short-chain dehydrogenases of various substrate specificities|uniref:SDR family NAD(P)-dependent oxidoreductase n=1 Tax=unclassified Dehalobacter TaxID=2635733 RepID=UPI00028A6EE8|nr:MULTISPECIES: SDR family oxidoreductase [unclassified Dehalobacter]AFV01762.1 3-oxoacyl-[acyl-carrier protein] reductase [Dehalobacter sp. DCA]AFV04798.1 Short-chain dehydrogenase/reductase SDR [Dehalobacter sp. CF]EQB19841.1 3-oxoacyl-[acyl-carrier protein] reductase [Dehalobacter sp. UNSWDHB]
MKALITGASSGIGRDIARVLSAKGYDLILVARRLDRLEDLKNELSCDVQTISLDLAQEESCFRLYNLVKDQEIDILINNAGFAVYGDFDQTDLGKELELINTNIKAVHILTKLFLQDFKQRDRGYILNVASSAAFLPGPLMAAYYASKAYVLRLTEAVHEELRKTNSKVYVGALCPGPVHTEFAKVANIKFGVKALNSPHVARYTVDQMLKHKHLIIPGVVMKAAFIFMKIMPHKILLSFLYKIQKEKFV